MRTYLLVDSLNLFMRAKNVTGKRGTMDMRIGMVLHILFNSLHKAWRDFGVDHVVICREGKHNWRKAAYGNYKANRAVDRAKRTQTEIEDDELFFEAFNDWIKFLDEKTNCSVLQCDVAEADDLIAVWTQTHTSDRNIIASSDSDFVQLLAPHVEIYNGITETHYTESGVKNADGENMHFIIEGSSRVVVKKPDPDFVPDKDWHKYQLFLKCVRGDKGDNIFTAYPGARVKGSSNRVGIREAYDDMGTKGFNYNNFMLQTWTDHHDVEHTVRDRFDFNRELIDLTAQPEVVRDACKSVIFDEINSKHKLQVGVHLMRFCNTWGLTRLSETPDGVAKMLNAGIVSE